MPSPSLIARLKARSKALKREIFALYLAVRDPETPWYAKALAALVAGYALSPIDLIPDFIPVLGYLDDLLLLPLGIALALRLVPPPVMERCRKRALEELAGRALVSRTAAAVIALIWLGIAALVITAFLAPRSP